jgi:Amt family ammonium transporter
MAEAEVNLASTAFMLVCMALVQLMTPGLAFFYGGLVPERSVLTMMMQSFVSMGVSTIFWYVVGFSLCFGESGEFMGSPWTYFVMRNINMNEALPGQEIPGLLFVAYQGMFAVITPALMTGAFADRFRFKPYLIYIVLWLVLVYVPWCHWIWGGGFLARWGVWDFAGGIVVHITAGFSALASLVVVGKRADEEGKDVPHNVPFVALGTALLWFGWWLSSGRGWPGGGCSSEF